MGADRQGGGVEGGGGNLIAQVTSLDETIDPTLDRPLDGPASVRRGVGLGKVG